MRRGLILNTVQHDLHAVWNVLLVCAAERITIPVGTCIAPLRAYIPCDLWRHLLERFLNSAIADSYEAEDQLLDLHRSDIEDTYVYPSAASPVDVEYTPRSALGRRLRQHAPTVIFQTMLDWDIITNLWRDFMYCT